MWDEVYQSYDNLDDYFADHPEEYDDYVDDMAELYGHEDPVDYPEDWQVYA